MSISFSLSLYTYIYMYTHAHVTARDRRGAGGRLGFGQLDPYSTMYIYLVSIVVTIFKFSYHILVIIFMLALSNNIII